MHEVNVGDLIILRHPSGDIIGRVTSVERRSQTQIITLDCDVTIVVAHRVEAQT